MRWGSSCKICCKFQYRSTYMTASADRNRPFCEFLFTKFNFCVLNVDVNLFPEQIISCDKAQIRFKFKFSVLIYFKCLEYEAYFKR